MALGLLWMIIIWVGSTLLLRLLAPKTKSPADPNPDVNPPETNEGDPIPFGFGRFRVKPHIIWWGDKERVPYKEVVVPAGFFNIEHLQTTAYDYKFGVWMAICWGRIDRLNDIVWDDDRSVIGQPGSRVQTGSIETGFGDFALPVYGSETPISPALPIGNAVSETNDGSVAITIHESELFGGRKSGGGLDGVMHFCFGNDGSPLPTNDWLPPNPPTMVQQPNAYLEAAIPADNSIVDNALGGVTKFYPVPQYPWMCYAVAEKMNFGEAQSMHGVAFDLNRWPRRLVDTQEGAALPKFLYLYDTHKMGQDANGAEVVCELLLNKDYGLGQYITEDDIDFWSFTNVAWLIYHNGFGISGTIDSKQSVKDLIEEIGRHCDFVVVYDQVLGKLAMTTTLTYPGLSPAIAATLTDDDITIKTHQLAGWKSRVNTVRVAFTNTERNFNEDIAMHDDIAQIQAAGRVIDQQFTYKLYTQRATAQRRAWRLLLELQGPQQIECDVTRAGASLKPGDRILLQSTKFNLGGIWVVGDLDYGRIEDGKIGMSLVEDIWDKQFAQSYAAASGSPAGQPSSPTWREPFVYANGEVIDDGATGLALLYIDDPYNTVVGWAFADWTPGDTSITYISSTGTYTHTVTLDSIGGQRIYWQVTYRLADGVTTATKEGYVTFGRSTAPLPVPSEGVSPWTRNDDRATWPDSRRVTSSDASVSITYDDLAGTVDLTTEGGGSGGGVSTGTPGNVSLPLYQGQAQIYDPMPSGLTEPQILKDNARKLHNFLNIVEIRLQAVIKQAVTGGKIVFQVSDNGGSVWKNVDLGSGGFVVTDAVGYPVPGDWFDVDPSLQVNNLIWRVVLYAPDGTTDVLEHGVIWLDTVSSDSPPPTEIPSDPTLPSDGGTTWGSIVLDLLGQNISGLANLARVTNWPDASASNYDGIPQTSGTGSVRNGGEYHESGFNTSYPYVKIKPSDYGWKVAAAGASVGNATYYYFIDAVTGGGTGFTTGDDAANLVSGDEGTNSGNYLRIQGDGKLFFFGGNSIFGASTGTGTANVADGNRHLIRMIHSASTNQVFIYVDGVLDMTINGGVGGNLTYPWTLWSFFGAGSAETHNLTANMHQAVWYDAAHPNTAGYNTVETGVLSRAGL